jgi:glyoxylase-like metal-dependent hydrolase (beta-lactamase superfamily II)
MNLEDHIGDVLRKARNSAGLSPTAVAKAAGLTPSELEALEQSGVATQTIHFGALGSLLGLNPARLEGLAHGWEPRAQELGRWRQLRQITTTQGGNAVNCFLIWDEHTREAALFDTGWEAAPIFKVINENRLELKHLFVTHTHHDHVAAVEPIRERWPALRLHIHGGSRTVLSHHRGPAEPPVTLGALLVEARAVPGHAEDGTAYVVSGWPDGAPHAAFVGDTIFAGSLAKGFVSTTILKQKVRDQIFTLPPETLLCPGHGPVTTVAEEIAHNPFF